MIVENIEYSSNYNLIKLIISGESFFISYDLFSDLNIRKNSELEFDTYKIILYDDEFNKCKIFALKQISYSQKTSFDIRKKLKDKQFSKDSIDKTIEYLEKFNLINDEIYVRSFVNDKSNISSWSKNKIFYKLKLKGIDDCIINKYLDLIDYEDEYKKALELAKRKVHNDFSFENKQKIYRFLANRGFSYDIIKKCLSEIIK